MSYIVFKSVMDFYLFDRESSRLVPLTSEEVVALSSRDGETKAKMEEKLRKQEVDFTNGRIIYNEKVSDISI